MFDVGVATELGVIPAVLLENIVFWCEKNRANNVHEHDGLYWTYNSVRAFSEMFPYASPKVLRTSLASLEEAGYIKSGCYNEAAYDKTKWYAATPKAYTSLGTIDLPHRAEGLCPTGQMTFAPEGKPIPDSKPDINSTDITPYSPPEDAVGTIVAYLNEVCGTSYRPTSQKTKRLVSARLKEGFTVDDFKRVIRVKADAWLKDPRMRQYLRPETLFGTKFESYLNEAPQRRADLSRFTIQPAEV